MEVLKSGFVPIKFGVNYAKNMLKEKAEK